MQKGGGGGEVYEESAEKTGVSDVSDLPKGAERPGVKDRLEVHVEEVKCILMASREAKTEIPGSA